MTTTCNVNVSNVNMPGFARYGFHDILHVITDAR